MGTSSARKAPVGKFWRIAKTSASRFASGKEATPPQVQDVVARYLTALQSPKSEANGPTRDFLPDLVRTADSLGDFYRTWRQQGWDAALVRLGLNPASYESEEAVIPDLLDKLAGPGARLDAAVSRAALIDHLVPLLSPAADSPGLDFPEATTLVRHFLGLALYRKLLADLGEPLEFHAPTINQGLQRQEELKSHILVGLEVLPSIATAAEAFSPNQSSNLLKLIIINLGGRREL